MERERIWVARVVEEVRQRLVERIRRDVELVFRARENIRNRHALG